jgi:hypothetical protein
LKRRKGALAKRLRELVLLKENRRACASLPRWKRAFRSAFGALEDATALLGYRSMNAEISTQAKSVLGVISLVGGIAIIVGGIFADQVVDGFVFGLGLIIPGISCFPTRRSK